MLVVVGEERRTCVQRLEDDAPARASSAVRRARRVPLRRQCRCRAACRVGTAVGADATSPASTTELDPGAGVAAVVHGVVDQPGVAADRDAAARGAEVGLGGDRVLLVAQVVADVGQQLDQRDARGRPGCARASRGIEQRQPVEHQPAEARVVLGEVVDLRRSAAARAGRRASGAQSKSVGQSTLNEKSTADSSGSKPAGGAVARSRPATRRSV